MFQVFCKLFVLLDLVLLTLQLNLGASNNLTSVAYNLTLKAFNFEKLSYNGILEIQATAKRNISEIFLVRGDYDLKNVEFYSDDFPIDCPATVEENSETVRIKPPQEVESGRNFTLTIYFEDAVSSLVRASFIESDSNINSLVLTNSDFAHVKNVFPFFDDPNLRVTMTLELSPVVNAKILSNSKEKLKRHSRFKTFEPMTNFSVHNFALVLTTFTASKRNFLQPKLDEELLSNVTCHDECVEIWSKTRFLNFTSYALKELPLILQKMSKTFGLDYPLKKLDLVVVPGYLPDKSFNLGLITLSENSVLYDDSEPSLVAKLRALRTLTRACASMWLQNIIVPAAEDQNLFLEGLAKYYEYFGPDQFNADYKLREQFLADVQQTAMLENHEHLDVKKVACIFKMSETEYDVDVFTQAVQKLFEARKYKTVSVHDIYEAFNHTVILPSWFEQSGYPVLNVTIQFFNLTIAQSRFDKKLNESGVWKIPIQLSNAGYGTKSLVFLDRKEFNCSNSYVSSDTVFVSREDVQGFYRVNYDKESWEKIIATLNSGNFESISIIDRSAILDDMFNLAKAGYLDYQILFKTLNYLKRENSYLPVKTAIVNFKYLMRIFATSENGKYYNDLMQFIRSVIYPVYEREYSKYFLKDTLLRRELFDFACSIGNENCIRHYKRSFEKFFDKRQVFRIPEDERFSLLCSVLQNGNQHHLNMINAKLLISETGAEVMDIYRALSCYQDIEELEHILNRTLSVPDFAKSGIYTPEALEFIRSYFSAHPRKAESTLKYFINNFNRTLSYFRGHHGEILRLVLGISKTYQSKKLAELIFELKGHFKDDQSKSSIDEVLRQMRRDVSFSENIKKRVVRSLGSSATNVTEDLEEWPFLENLTSSSDSSSTTISPTSSEASIISITSSTSISPVTLGNSSTSESNNFTSSEENTVSVTPITSSNPTSLGPSDNSTSSEGTMSTAPPSTTEKPDSSKTTIGWIVVVSIIVIISAVILLLCCLVPNVPKKTAAKKGQS